MEISLLVLVQCLTRVLHERAKLSRLKGCFVVLLPTLMNGTRYDVAIMELNFNLYAFARQFLFMRAPQN